MFNLLAERESVRLKDSKRQYGTCLEFCICSGISRYQKRACAILCMNQGGNADKARSLFRDAGFLYFLEGGRLTMAKEQVQAITKMEEDFAQWYTDIVKSRTC